MRKIFRFDHSYVVRVETSVAAKGTQISAFPMWPAGFGDEMTRRRHTPPAASSISPISRFIEATVGALKSVSSGNTLRGPLNWAGAIDQYFAAAFIPRRSAKRCPGHPAQRDRYSKG